MGQLCPDLGALKGALRLRIHALAETLLGQPNRSLSSRRNLRWGNKGSISVIIGGPKTGLCADFEAGQSGDALWLIQHTRRCSFGEACAWAASWIGISAGGTNADSAAERAERRRQRDRQRRRERERAETDRQRRIRIAQFIASHAASIEPGSLADQYLTGTRGIPRPASGWPDSICFLPAWSDQPASVGFFATDRDGQLCGVQRVNLDGHARKIDKRSRGAFDDAVVRLPGSEGSPLLIAEGPETGLSVWAGTGFETWIAVGSLGRLALPLGRRVVICADDDKDGSAADRALQRAVDGWRLAGIDLVIARPWTERREDKSDFNDLIKAGGPEAVAAQIDFALCPTERIGLRKRVAVEDARVQIKAAADAFFVAVQAGADETLAHGIRADVGTGKSAIVRQAIAELLAAMRELGDARTIVIAAPYHALAAEAVALFNQHPLARKHGLRAAQWRGRQADDPSQPGKTMCQDLDRIEAAQVAGAGDIEKACCHREMPDGAPSDCPFYQLCGYQKQKRQGSADLWFVAHEILFSQKPAIIGDVAAKVIDESFWQSGLIGVDGSLALTLEMLRLAPTPDGLDGQYLQHARSVLADVLTKHPNGPMIRHALLSANVTLEMAHKAYRLEWSLHRPPDLHPGMTREQFAAAKRAADPNRTARRLARLWHSVAALLSDDGPAMSGWASLGVDHLPDGDVRKIFMKGRRDFSKGWTCPTLLIDATLAPDLARFYLPTLEVTADIAVTIPHARVIQIEGRSNSKRRLINTEGTTATEQRRRAKHRDELGGTIRKITRKLPGSNGLVVSQLEVENWLREYGNLPASVELAHYNALAGRDCWKNVRFLILIGRVSPRPADVQAMAEALSGAAVEHIDGPFPRRQVARQMAGGWARPAEAAYHPNPLCETIRHQITEAEIIQAVGRARAVNRKAADPVTIFLLTNVAVDLPVDQLMPAKTLDPDAIDEQMDAGGVAFLNSTHAAQAYPSRTSAGWKSALQAAGKWDAIPNKDSFSGSTSHFRRVKYQLPGQGQKPAEALVDPTQVADPRAWIEDMLGPLATFELIEEPAAAAPAPRRPVLRRPAEVPEPGRPFWLDPVVLPPAPPDWTLPPWLVPLRSSRPSRSPGWQATD